MQNHWHILYTKAKSEKKVSGLLTKKKITNFCPVHARQINRYNRIKLIYEPLFSCYVFAYIDETEINLVKQLRDVINLVYWKGRPAIVQKEEIEEIREFVSHHQNIRLERSGVKLDSLVSVVAPSYYWVDGNVVMIKNKLIKVFLPSLGFTMLAEVEGDGVLGKGIGVEKEKRELQHDVFTSL